MNDVLTMIVSAIVGGIAWWIFTEFLIPVVGGWLNKSPDISGSWNYYDEETGDAVGTANIKQTGTRLKIIATRTKSRNSSYSNREFIIKGATRGRDIICTYEQKNAGGFVSGAIVLRADSRLNSLRGIASYYSDSDGTVITQKIFFKK